MKNIKQAALAVVILIIGEISFGDLVWSWAPDDSTIYSVTLADITIYATAHNDITSTELLRLGSTVILQDPAWSNYYEYGLIESVIISPGETQQFVLTILTPIAEAPIGTTFVLSPTIYALDEDLALISPREGDHPVTITIIPEPNIAALCFIGGFLLVHMLGAQPRHRAYARIKRGPR